MNDLATKVKDDTKVSFSSLPREIQEFLFAGSVDCRLPVVSRAHPVPAKAKKSHPPMFENKPPGGLNVFSVCKDVANNTIPWFDENLDIRFLQQKFSWKWVSSSPSQFHPLYLLRG